MFVHASSHSWRLIYDGVFHCKLESENFMVFFKVNLDGMLEGKCRMCWMHLHVSFGWLWRLLFFFFFSFFLLFFFFTSLFCLCLLLFCRFSSFLLLFLFLWWLLFFYWYMRMGGCFKSMCLFHYQWKLLYLFSLEF